MGPVAAAIPLHWRCEESRGLVDPIVSAEFLAIAVQNNAIGPGSVNANAIITVALSGMEIEDEDGAGSFKHDYFVSLVLEGNVGLRCSKPALFRLTMIHGGVKVV